jgi:hypothetical protein
MAQTDKLTMDTKADLKTCRSCGSSNLTPFFDLGAQPFANSLLKTEDEPEESYPLALTFCNDCSLVQLTYTADPEVLFSRYVWVTGTSSTARRQAQKFCNDVLSRFPPNELPRLVVEVASNDGTFLRPFIDRKIPVLGVDPAVNVAEQANRDGIPTRCDFFDEKLARSLLAERGAVDVVIVRNVLPHVAALHSVVKGIAILVGATGFAAIEVHYGKKILEGLQYDSIYHEHLCYFTVQSIGRLLATHGLEIVDLDQGPINAGALIVYARQKGSPKTDTVKRFIDGEVEAGTNSLLAWRNFADRASRHRSELNSILDAELAAGRTTVGYGASARSSTMLNYCGIDRRKLICIADAAPLKKNCFTAGTRIPIRAPKEAFAMKPDNILLLAWNFREEILEILRDQFEFTGKIIHPLPTSPTVQMIS